jgi:hypothetical protein
MAIVRQEAPPFRQQSLSDFTIPLQRLEVAYRAFEASGDHDPEQALRFLSAFVTAQMDLLRYLGLHSTLSALLFEIVENAKHGTKHHSLREDAPEKPRWQQKQEGAARIQAQAAVVLQRARDTGEQQKKWAKDIADHLGKVGFKRGRWGKERPAGPYTPDSIILWRKQCLSGKHPASGLFRALLEHVRKDQAGPVELLGYMVGIPLPPVFGE